MPRSRRLPFALSALLLAGAILYVARPAGAVDSCVLPAGGIACLTDTECAAYGAVCDVPMGRCLCPALDAAPLGDGGGGDALSAVDLASSRDAPPPTSLAPGGGSSAILPPRQSGCSVARF
jgi:hypothetical protein